MAFASKTWGSSFPSTGTTVQREECPNGALPRHGQFAPCCFGDLRKKSKSFLSSADDIFVRKTQPFGGWEALRTELKLSATVTKGLRKQLRLQPHNKSLLKCRFQGSTAMFRGWPLHWCSGHLSIRFNPTLQAGHETIKDGGVPFQSSAGICIPTEANGGRAVEQVSKTSGLWQFIKLGALVLPTLLIGVLPALATMKAATGGTSGAVVGRAFTSQRGSQIFASAWTGLIAGCLHTLTGPDHLAALAPLSIGRSKLKGALVGALWGCGHDAGQVLFGLLFILLKDKLHIDLIRTWSARVVGLTLLAIGGVGMREAQEASLPCLPGDGSHLVITESAESYTVLKKPFGFATFFTGVVHGLQPDALLVILPALALPSRLAGISFLSMFLLGTVLSMGSYTAFIGSCSEELNKRVPWITHRLAWGSSLIAMAVGISILLGELFGINLF